MIDDVTYFTEVAGRLQELADTYNSGSLYERTMNRLFSKFAARYRRRAAKARQA